MEARYPPLEAKFWGDWALFTRPEMKAERVSYPLPTPSAARGLLEAVFWKPEMRWRVEEIWLLKPVRYFSMVRNEVNSVASVRSAQAWERDGGGYFASQDRAQRHSLGLRDVAYLIKAHVDVKPGVNEDPAKFRDQFRRRLRGGRCFSQPYFGCREFAAAFGEPAGGEAAVPVTEDLGLMLLDLDYQSDGRGSPRFFAARLENGILRVPGPKKGKE